MGSRERVGENPGRHQSVARRHSSGTEQRVARGGENHGIGKPQELHPDPGDLHDGTHDDHYTADVVWLPPRLHPQRTGEHRLTSAAELVHADCTGWWPLLSLGRWKC